jgi:hypothetical protein
VEGGESTRAVTACIGIMIALHLGVCNSCHVAATNGHVTHYLCARVACFLCVRACVRAYAQEEQRRRDTASRKLLAEREIKRRREAEGVGCGATQGRWRVVLESSWWGPQSYAV